ncbi:MAG: MFS transporter [Patescibacteria group bacterium]
MAKATIRTYFLLSSVANFAICLTHATYVTFLMSKGLDLFEVNLVNFVFYVTMVLAEIPTGAIADIYGRKFSFFCACSINAIGVLVYAASTSFPGFAVAEFILAIGFTCSSGAFQAWLVDRLKEEGYEQSVRSVLAKESQIDYSMGMIAALIGARLADKNMALPWIASGIMFVIAAALTLRLMRENHHRPSHIKAFDLGHMAETIRLSTRYARKNEAIRIIAVIGIIQYITVQPVNMYWQPFFLPQVGSKTALGFVWAGMSISMIIGAAIHHGILRYVHKDEKRALVLVQCAIGVGIVLTATLASIPMIFSSFFIYEVSRGAFRPLKDTYLNDNVPKEQRATILSCESIIHHIGGSVGLLLSGYMAKNSSIPITWIMSGTILLLGTLLVAKLARCK